MRVDPLAGEAIDSWLETTGRRMDLSLGQMFDALGILRSRWNEFIVLPTSAELRILTESTGQAAPAVLAMTLSRYNGTALSIDSNTGGRARTFPYGTRAGSRYCPSCLKEAPGRWQLHWRLGWAFICLKHSLVLADVCPTCERIPRKQKPGTSPVPPNQCSCGTDLSGNYTHELPRTHQICVAQQTVFDVIAADSASFGVYANQAPPPSARSTLGDVAALANQVLNYACLHGLQSTVRDHSGFDIPSELIDANSPVRGSPGGGGRAPSRSLDLAIAVTAAVQILAAPDLDGAAERAHWLSGGSRRWRGASALLNKYGGGAVSNAVLIKAHSLRMSPIDQLRWRTALPTACAPSEGGTQLDELAPKMPSSMWASWVLCMPSAAGNSHRAQSCALTVATLMVGTTADPTDVIGVVGGGISRKTFRHTIDQLSNAPHWTSIRMALSRLNDYLEKHSVPINYERRRSLDYSRLLPERRWRSLCREADVPTGGGLRWVEAQQYLTRKLNGSPIKLSDLARYTKWPINLMAKVNNFPLTVTRSVVEAMDAEALEFLSRNAISEPPTWSPPLDLIADLEMPRRDVCAIEIREMHDLVVKHSYTCSRLSKYLGLDPPAVRHLFEQHPLDDTQDMRPRQQPAMKEFGKLRRRLGAATLRDLYSAQRLPVKEIMERYGATRRQVEALRDEYRIPTRSRRVAGK